MRLLTKRVTACVIAMIMAITMFPAVAFASLWDSADVVHTGDSVNDDPHVVRITIPSAQHDAIRASESGLLTLAPDWGGSANRRVWVWTDLSPQMSGASGNPVLLSFLTDANVQAGAILQTAELSPVTVTIPIELLYSGGNFAQHIYMITTLHYPPEGAHAPLEDFLGEGNLRRDLTNSITHATLTLAAPAEFASNISLNWGVNETEMRFTWWTPRGEASAAVVQIAPFADLVGGQMPADARTITGRAPVALPMAQTDQPNHPDFRFDVNRVAVPDLSANTRYAYRVGDGTNWSSIYHFYTFNPGAGSQTIIIAGDPQIGGAGIARQLGKWQNSLDAAVARVNTMGRPGVDFILNTGDVATPANDAERMSVYLTPHQLRNIPVFVNVGNHDTVEQGSAGDGRPRPLGLLSQVYYWPNHDWLGGNPNHASNYLRGGGNHFFSYGDVLYISINMNETTLERHRPILQAATASHPDATWRIVHFHQDIFGSGTGHAAGMPASGRQDFSAILYEFDIDIVINGHEHTHGRSHFMRGTENIMEQRPADFGRNRDERLVFDAHPGAFIAPEGIPFITVGSVADFPKYTSIFPMLPWVAWTDPPELDDHAQYSIMTIDGDSLTIETWVIPYDPSTWTPSGAPEFMSNSFTIRRTARFEDLQLLITGADALAQGNVSTATWEPFQTAISAARPLTAASSAASIHAAFMEIYDRYYALINTADRTALSALVSEVEEVLETAVEGPWMGMFPEGSIDEIRAVLEPAALVNSVRLSTQAQIDAQYALLRPAFTSFLMSASPVPRPWVAVHEIPATGVYTLGLLNWMDDSARLNLPWEEHPNVSPRFFAHNTKVNFAGGSFGDVYTTLVPPRDVPVRPDEPFGPANAAGGRTPIAFGPYEPVFGHVTRTHVGEWIRYELNVAQAGEYRVHLGAINPNSSAMEVLLRDINYNTLTSFTIPANHGVAEGWTDANALIEAESTIFLPQGRFILEMVFLNDRTTPVHRGSGLPATYADGPNVDLLTLERVGDMTPPVVTRDTGIFVLPLPPNDAAGNALRQRGWATIGVENEWGVITTSRLTTNEIAATTHIVFDVAARPFGNVDVVLAGGHSGEWTQDTMQMAQLFDPETFTVTIDLSEHRAFELWSDTSDGASRRIIVSHNNDSWEEMNIIRAYLVLEGFEPGEPTRRIRVSLDSYEIIDLIGDAPPIVMDVLPQIIDGRTLLPIRFLVDALGGETDWDSETRTVTIALDGQGLEFQIGELLPGMDVPGLIIDGRTMVPARFVSEFFGALVEWDAETRSFEIIL